MEQRVTQFIIIIFFLIIANPELIRANNAKQVFQNRLPLPLRERKPEEKQTQEKTGPAQPAAEDDSKKEESKEHVQEQPQKKEEMSYDVGSEGEKSEDESKKIDQKKLEKELSQIIYITLTETPTNILFYCPSTKYLNLKNGKL